MKKRKKSLNCFTICQKESDNTSLESCGYSDIVDPADDSEVWEDESQELFEDESGKNTSRSIP